MTAAADRPYGVRLNGIGSVNSFQNRYEMQGKEKESTFGLNRVNFGARTLNPTTGVWDRIDPLAELDFNLGAYTYVGNNPINAVDLWGIKRVPIDGTRNYYDDETGELTVVGDKNNVNAAFGFDLMYQAHARNKREFGEASPYQKHFQDGGAIAAGVATAPLAIIAAAEVGAGAGVSYLSQIVRASAGRWSLRKSLTNKNSLLTFGNANIGAAVGDFMGQYGTNGNDITKINWISTGSQLLIGGNLLASSVVASGLGSSFTLNGEGFSVSNFREQI